MILDVILDALTGAKAFADLATWRKIGVTGPDSLRWLNELVSADVGSLRPGSAQHCLLLDDAGELRADLTVAVQGSSVVVVQDPAQLRPIDDLLGFYTEGFDVDLEDRTNQLSIFAFPSRPSSPDLGGTSHYAPSALGAGSDLVCMPEDHDRLSRSLQKSLALASPDDLEAWRIAGGHARMGIDAFEGDLPQEVGLMGAVDLGKQTFLGREALASITAATPLRTVVVALRTSEPVSPGDELAVDGERAGELTSVTDSDDGVLALARVFWELRSGPFATKAGVDFDLRIPEQ